MVRGAKLLLLKNTITMVKFLQVDTAANGNLLIPLKDLIFIQAFSTTAMYVRYNNQYSVNDHFEITHAADADSDAKIGSMADVLRKLVIDAAQGRWSDAVVNITSLVPKPISNITIV